MSTEYRLTRSELAQRYFACPHCGAQGEVIFGAEGSSGWQQDTLLGSPVHERVERQAEVDLRTDAMRTQALIACPTCGERSPGAVRWMAIRVGFLAIVAVAIPIIGGVQFVVGGCLFGALAIWQAWRERGRWNRAGRAVITKLVPGKAPEHERSKPAVRRQLAPPPDLPAARVIAAPAPIVHDEPDPTAPPKFLKP